MDFNATKVMEMDLSNPTTGHSNHQMYGLKAKVLLPSRHHTIPGSVMRDVWNAALSVGVLGPRPVPKEFEILEKRVIEYLGSIRDEVKNWNQHRITDEEYASELQILKGFIGRLIRHEIVHKAGLSPKNKWTDELPAKKVSADVAGLSYLQNVMYWVPHNLFIGPGSRPAENGVPAQRTRMYVQGHRGRPATWEDADPGGKFESRADVIHNPRNSTYFKESQVAYRVAKKVSGLMSLGSINWTNSIALEKFKTAVAASSEYFEFMTRYIRVVDRRFRAPIPYLANQWKQWVLRDIPNMILQKNDQQGNPITLALARPANAHLPAAYLIQGDERFNVIQPPGYAPREERRNVPEIPPGQDVVIDGIQVDFIHWTDPENENNQEALGSVQGVSIAGLVEWLHKSWGWDGSTMPDFFADLILEGVSVRRISDSFGVKWELSTCAVTNAFGEDSMLLLTFSHAAGVVTLDVTVDLPVGHDTRLLFYGGFAGKGNAWSLEGSVCFSSGEVDFIGLLEGVQGRRLDALRESLPQYLNPHLETIGVRFSPADHSLSLSAMVTLTEPGESIEVAIVRVVGGSPLTYAHAVVRTENVSLSLLPYVGASIPHELDVHINSAALYWLSRAVSAGETSGMAAILPSGTKDQTIEGGYAAGVHATVTLTGPSPREELRLHVAVG
ncbi:hypothetical protein V3C41_00495 [Paenarthrobacter nicotinovorans]|uniref:Uncharacterized protein n=1 Tax=Paenarthrobacter nicotinovorans TaxID=29320 RepID=A0ABV0GLV7_PAENI